MKAGAREMCGIAFRTFGCTFPSAEENELCKLLRRRGPDAQGQNDAGYLGVFYAAVLHMRGAKLCQQPAEDEEGNILCFNGELYSFGTDAEPPVLLSGLSVANTNARSIAAFMSRLKGPWSIIYAHRASGCVFSHATAWDDGVSS